MLISALSVNKDGLHRTVCPEQAGVEVEAVCVTNVLPK